MIRLDFGKPTQEKEQAFAHIPRTPPTLTELLCQIIMKLSDLGRALARFLGDRKREDTMPNIQDYVLWRGDLPLERVPLCDVDALLLSYLSYMPYDNIVGDAFDGGISLRDAAQKLLENWLAAETGSSRAEVRVNVPEPEPATDETGTAEEGIPVE